MEAKNAKVCYEELKNKSMSIEQFRTYLGNVVNIKDFASNFLNVINEDIKGDHNNLNIVIEALKEMANKNDIGDNERSKIIDALIDIAKKIQDKQWTPTQLLKALGTIAIAIIAIILGINNKKQ